MSNLFWLSGQLSIIFTLVKQNANKYKEMAPTALMTAKRKSVRLSPEVFKALKRYRKAFTTEVECAETIRIKRETLNRVLLIGSGSPETIGKIEEALGVKESN